MIESIPPSIPAFSQDRKSKNAGCKKSGLAYLPGMADRGELQGWLRRVMERNHWTAEEWARRAKVAPTSITRFLSRPDAPMMGLRTLSKLEEAAKETFRGPPRTVEIPMPGELPRDLPVYGVGGANKYGAVQLTEGEVDFVRRPPALEKVKNAYGIYVEGSSMTPRYEHGELVLVHPGRPASPGDYVVVQARSEAGEREWYIKRLVRRTATKVILSQLNPVEQIELDLKRVEHIHRIMSTHELYGM
jgi:SOS-response transcriptional repressor LexA